VVTTGKAKRTTKAELLSKVWGGGGVGAHGKKRKKGGEDEEDEEEDEEEDQRYLLGTFVVEVQQSITVESYK
jgi:hypothetical protein